MNAVVHKMPLPIIEATAEFTVLTSRLQQAQHMFRIIYVMDFAKQQNGKYSFELGIYVEYSMVNKIVAKRCDVRNSYWPQT